MLYNHKTVIQLVVTDLMLIMGLLFTNQRHLHMLVLEIDTDHAVSWQICIGEYTLRLF